MNPKSPNPETEAMGRAGNAQRPAHDEDRKAKLPPAPRPDTAKKPDGSQGAKPRDGL